MRLTNQRGVSLMLLILAITVFAAVAIGIVTLLSARYQSYPYQVESYQAYALANAGVEFAIRYAKDNNTDPMASNSFFQHPEYYIPTDRYKDFTFGNGKFSLKYAPGCPDMLYSKGTYGTATREVQLTNFSLYFGATSNSAYVVPGTITRTCYGPGCAAQQCWNGTGYSPCPPDPYPGPYSGDRIQFGYCVNKPADPNCQSPTMLAGESSPTVYIAARSLTNPSQQVSLGRIGAKDNGVKPPGTVAPGGSWDAWWIWDATCGITGVALNGVNSAGHGPYCPEAVTGWGYTCPATSTSNPGSPFIGMVDCVVSNDGHNNTGHFNFPALPVWDGTTDATGRPPASVLYPVYWNTNTTGSTSVMYDSTCRPQVPCDHNNPGDPNCDVANACTWTGPGAQPQCGYDNQPATAGAVERQGHYSCYDDTGGCLQPMQGNTIRSQFTCHAVSGSNVLPFANVPVPALTLTNFTLETIGHLYNILPVQFYVTFPTVPSTTGSCNQQTVNKFLFTVSH